MSAVVLPLEALGKPGEVVREGRRVKAEQDGGRQSRETATAYAIFCGISTDKGKRVRLAARSAKPLRDMSRLRAQHYAFNRSTAERAATNSLNGIGYLNVSESGGIKQVA